jgi:hypothetical protein
MKSISRIDKHGNLHKYTLNENDTKEGLYKIFYKDGTHYEEKYYKNGKLDGLYTIWQNGILVTEIEYKNNVKNGRTKMDGKYIRWEGSYKNNKLVAESKYFWKKGFICKHFFWNQDGSIKDIKYFIKGWKVLKKIINSKIHRRLIKKMFTIKNHIYNIQGDTTIYKCIIEYLTVDELQSIITEVNLLNKIND